MSIMENLTNTLQSLYDTALQSEIDSVFYQSIHDYLDVLVKTPELSTLIEKESQKLKNKLREIKNDPVLPQRKKVKLIERTEQLSVYKDYINLYSTIYVPLEDQANGIDVDSNALYYILGIEALSEKDQAHVGWSFKKHHEDYEKYFKDLHAKLLPLIEKMEVKKDVIEIPHKKPIITFNDEKSILTINGKQVMITLKNDKTDGHYVLEYLFEFGIDEPADYVDILEHKFRGDKKNNMSMYRACNDINKKVSEQANISNFLAIHSGITGWVQVNSEFR